MTQAEYEARRVNHAEAVQAALAEASEPVQSFIRANHNLALMPLGFVREQVQKLERFRDQAGEAERGRILYIVLQRINCACADSGNGPLLHEAGCNAPTLNALILSISGGYIPSSESGETT